jgi:serpin B
MPASLEHTDLATLTRDVKEHRATLDSAFHSRISAAVGGFAFDLLRALDSSENVVFSPESVAVALGMTALGARGATLAAFERVLHLPESIERRLVHAALGDRGSYRGDGVTMTSANRVFGQTAYAFRPEYSEALAACYGSALERLDFRESLEHARVRINKFVSSETEGLIRELLAPGVIDETARVVLVNAVYLKALWQKPFAPFATRTEPFRVTASRSVDAEMMTLGGKLAYAKDDASQLVVLPYRSGFDAVVVLPTHGALENVVQRVGFERLNALVTSARHVPVWLKLPRLRIGWNADLADPLSALGLGVAFSEQADFGGMAPKTEEPPVRVTSVIHQALLAVDEEGTEASAATAVAIMAGAAPDRTTPIKFHVDRPFLFLVRDRVTGRIAFMARVVDPTAS